MLQRNTVKEFWINPVMEPRIVSETSSYLVIYKPPKMHTAPLRAGEENTLLDWVVCRFPEVQKISGHKEIEGGLIHRLDYETQGLVLCARTEAAFQMLTIEQKAGNIIKEYDAVCRNDCSFSLPGFPPLPDVFNLIQDGTVIASAFRPFGKGRNAVRPVLRGDPRHKAEPLYRTEILSCINDGDKSFIRIRIDKGFRHQIRCHLAWIGLPILNDSVYGSVGDPAESGKSTESHKSAKSGTPTESCEVSAASGNFLALRASAVSFADPDTQSCFRISAAK